MPKGKWEATTPPGWCVRCLPASENALMSCRWKRRLVLFLLVQHMSTMVIWFVVGRPFFFLSSLFLKSYSLTLLVVGISTPVLIFFISNFVFILLHNFYLFSISSFNFNLSNIIFSNLVLILRISNFLPSSFCISFIGF